MDIACMTMSTASHIRSKGQTCEGANGGSYWGVAWLALVAQCLAHASVGDGRVCFQAGCSSLIIGQSVMAAVAVDCKRFHCQPCASDKQIVL
jgi:hypothetical protein